MITQLKMYSWIKSSDLKLIHCCENTAASANEDSPKAMIGKDDTQLIWHDRANEYLYGEKKALQGEVTQYYLLLKTNQGDRKIMVSKGPLLNRSGTIVGTIGSSIDITDKCIFDKLGYFDKNGRLHLTNKVMNASLSKVEVLVLRGILHGLSARSIANKLCRSVRTIEDHIQSIRIKLQCETKGDILCRAFELGLLYLFFDNQNP